MFERPCANTAMENQLPHNARKSTWQFYRVFCKPDLAGSLASGTLFGGLYIIGFHGTADNMKFLRNHIFDRLVSKEIPGSKEKPDSCLDLWVLRIVASGLRFSIGFLWDLGMYANVEPCSLPHGEQERLVRMFHEVRRSVQ